MNDTDKVEIVFECGGEIIKTTATIQTQSSKIIKAPKHITKRIEEPLLIQNEFSRELTNAICKDDDFIVFKKYDETTYLIRISDCSFTIGNVNVDADDHIINVSWSRETVLGTDNDVKNIVYKYINTKM